MLGDDTSKEVTTNPFAGDSSGKKDSALDNRYHFNYNDVANINGSGSEKLPYFEDKYFSWYKHRMKMYLCPLALQFGKWWRRATPWRMRHLLLP